MDPPAANDKKPARRLAIALLAPLVAAVLIRLVALFWLAPNAVVIADSVGYLMKARAIKAGDEEVATSANGQTRPPLYAMLVTLGLDGDEPPDDMNPGVFLLQIAADLGTIALAMGLTRRRFGKNAAIATGWAIALWPSSILFSSTIVMAESAACFTAVLALWCVDNMFAELRTGRFRARSALVAGVALGISVLTKELMLLLPFAVVLALIKMGKAPLEAKMKAIGTMCLTFVGVMIPFALLTATNQGKALPTGTYGYLALIFDNAPSGRSGQEMWNAETTVEKRIELAQSVFIDAIFEYPGLTAVRALQRLEVLCGPEIYAPCLAIALPYDHFVPRTDTPRGTYSSAWRFPAGSTSRPAQIVFTLFSFVLFTAAGLGIAAKRFDPLARVASYHVLTLVVVVALTVSMERYRMTLVPSLAPFIGLGFSMLLQRGERRALKPRAIVIASLVAIVLAYCMFFAPPPTAL